jgi:hypothetical protein
LTEKVSSFLSVFSVSDDSVIFEIPLLFYKGYQAFVTDTSGKTQKLTVEPGKTWIYIGQGGRDTEGV